MMWLGGSPRELDDVFAEVGLDRLDAGRLERIVEGDLLGDHRLALGDGLRADRLGRCRARSRAPPRRPGANAPGRRSRAPSLVGLEIEIEMLERVVLDRPGAVAQRLELGQPGDRACARSPTKSRVMMPSAFCSSRIAPAPRATFSLKALVPTPLMRGFLPALADRRPVGHVRPALRRRGALDRPSPRAEACRPC